MMLPDPNRSRVVLVGASRYEHLAALPSVDRNLDKLQRLLTEPSVWGVAPEHCVLVRDPRSADDVLDVLRIAAGEASDALVFYFAGHGLLQPETEDLYLGLTTTTVGPLHRALRYDEVRRLMLSNAACASKVVILDCCYSGRAMAGGMAGTSEIADRTRIEGAYLLTASTETALALAPPDEALTAFTGELVNVMAEGVPNGEDLLTLDTIYFNVRSALQAKTRPTPQRRSRNDGGLVALARNRCGRQGSGAVRAAEDRRRDPPEGYAHTLRMPPADLVKIVRELRAGGDDRTADAILVAAVRCRSGQEVASLAAHLRASGEDVVTVLTATADQPAQAVAELRDALVTMGERDVAALLLSVAGAGSADRIAGLAGLLPPGEQTVLLDAAASARSGRASRMIELVGALWTSDLQEPMESMLGRLGRWLPPVDAAQLADALREAGREELAIPLYAKSSEVLSERRVADLVDLMVMMRSANAPVQADGILGLARARCEDPQAVAELLETLWTAGLVDTAKTTMAEVALRFGDDETIHLAALLRDGGRELEAFELVMLALAEPAADSVTTHVIALLEAGRPVDATRMLDAVGARMGAPDIIATAVALQDRAAFAATRLLRAAFASSPECAADLVAGIDGRPNPQLTGYRQLLFSFFAEASPGYTLSAAAALLNSDDRGAAFAALLAAARERLAACSSSAQKAVAVLPRKVRAPLLLAVARHAPEAACLWSKQTDGEDLADLLLRLPPAETGQVLANLANVEAQDLLRAVVEGAAVGPASPLLSSASRRPRTDLAAGLGLARRLDDAPAGPGGWSRSLIRRCSAVMSINDIVHFVNGGDSAAIDHLLDDIRDVRTAAFVTRLAYALADHGNASELLSMAPFAHGSVDAETVREFQGKAWNSADDYDRPYRSHTWVHGVLGWSNRAAPDGGLERFIATRITANLPDSWLVPRTGTYSARQAATYRLSAESFGMEPGELVQSVQAIDTAGRAFVAFTSRAVYLRHGWARPHRQRITYTAMMDASITVHFDKPLPSLCKNGCDKCMRNREITLRKDGKGRLTIKPKDGEQLAIEAPRSVLERAAVLFRTIRGIIAEVGAVDPDLPGSVSHG